MPDNWLSHLLLINIPRKITVQGCSQLDEHQFEFFVSDKHVIPLLDELRAIPGTKTNFVDMNELVLLQDGSERNTLQKSHRKRIMLTMEVLENSLTSTSNHHISRHTFVTIFWTGDDNTYSELKKTVTRHWSVLFDNNPPQHNPL